MFDDLVVASLTARALPPSHDVALCTTHCLGGLAPVASPSDDEAGIASVSLDRRAFLSLSTSQQGPTAACLHVALASMVAGHMQLGRASLGSTAQSVSCRVGQHSAHTPQCQASAVAVGGRAPRAASFAATGTKTRRSAGTSPQSEWWNRRRIW